jgi:hypothetical protein
MVRIFSSALILGCLTLQAPTGPVAIRIQNASFEQLAGVAYPQADNCGAASDAIPPGWSVQGQVRSYQPFNPNPCLRSLPPDGSTVVLLFDELGNPATVYQDLGVTAADLQALARDGLYVMTFYVANYNNTYPGYYEAKLSLGANELCSADGWATYKFKPVTLTCPSPGFVVYDQWPGWSGAAPFDPSAHLILSISALDRGWPLMADLPSLTFTPTPYVN